MRYLRIFAFFFGFLVSTVHAQTPTIGRQDVLVLYTMNQSEMLTYILDACEDSLNEFEPAWIQQTATTGYWKMPAPVTNDAEYPRTNCIAPAVAYTLLLFERPKPLYAGKYDRATLLKHLGDFRRGYPNNCSPADGMQMSLYKFIDACLAANGVDWPMATNNTFMTTAQRSAIFDSVKNETGIAAGSGGFGFQGGFANYSFWVNSTDIKRTDPFLRYMFRTMMYFSTPTDRAIRWAGDDVLGRSLADLRSLSHGRMWPDFVTDEHQHSSWHYIQNSVMGEHLGNALFTAALCQPVENIPAPIRESGDLSKGFIGCVRSYFRNHQSADGSIIWAFGMPEYSPTYDFSLAFAADATVNKNQESAAYLSRSVQGLMWRMKRPFYEYPEFRGRPYAARFARYVLPVYYMVKNWGLPSTLPSWSEAQKTDGGVIHNGYSLGTIHRNPHKVIHVNENPYGTNGWDASTELVCNFSPAPCKQGHGMEFLQQFHGYGMMVTKDHIYTPGVKMSGAYPINGPYPTGTRPELPAALKLTEMKPNRLSSVWGDYGVTNIGIMLNMGTMKFTRQDDGFGISFAHTSSGNNIKRALFSLSGRMTAIIEDSPTTMGKMVPMQFWVKNLDLKSNRTGWVPKVNWQIYLPGQTVSFGDNQATTGFQNLTLATSKWYNIDDLYGVATTQPLPIVLAASQFPDLRDTIYHGPSKGVSAVIYSGTEASRMNALASGVVDMTGLPGGWRGLKAPAPEGYRIFCWAKFSGTTNSYLYQGAETEGAPIFSIPTQILSASQTRATILLPSGVDHISEEPRWYVCGHSGATVDAQGTYQRLKLKASGSSASVTVRFFSETTGGNLTVYGTSSASGVYDAATLRSTGVQVDLAANQEVWLAVDGASDRDQMGPFVEITSPTFTYNGNGLIWTPLSGLYTFKAEAKDRSEVSRVEFYLNNGQLLGTDSESPFECSHSIQNSYVQMVYAVAYDRAGNQKRSFDVPFGDGSVGPSMMGQTVVNQAPAVQITGPLSNSTCDSLSPIILSADAWDINGKVSKVEFYRNGIKIGEDTQTPYVCNWSTGSPGTYTITAKAIDDVGVETVSQPITLTVIGSGSADADSDGLQDDWEVQYFGGTNNPQAQPNLDVDGDGLNNLAEQSVGTDPTKASSRFATTGEQFVSASNFQIIWQSVAGKNYQIEYSSNMSTWNVAGNVTASGATASWTDDGSATGGVPGSVTRRYYRVKSF